MYVVQNFIFIPVIYTKLPKTTNHKKAPFVTEYIFHSCLGIPYLVFLKVITHSTYSVKVTWCLSTYKLTTYGCFTKKTKY